MVTRLGRVKLLPVTLSKGHNNNNNYTTRTYWTFFRKAITKLRLIAQTNLQVFFNIEIILLPVSIFLIKYLIYQWCHYLESKLIIKRNLYQIQSINKIYQRQRNSIEAVICRCPLKLMFLNVSQILQENTCVGVPF